VIDVGAIDVGAIDVGAIDVGAIDGDTIDRNPIGSGVGMVGYGKRGLIYVKIPSLDVDCDFEAQVEIKLISRLCKTNIDKYLVSVNLYKD
jgi:hypothetical protein